MAEALTYPGARWKPLGAQTESRMRSHDIICLHTMVGYLTSTDRFFRISNGAAYRGTESHYGVGGKWGPDLGGGLDGAVWQWQDRAYQADANLDGNHRVISIETADNAPQRASDIAAWTPKQVTALAKLIRWECSPAAHAKCPSSWTCHQHGIPLVLIPDSRPGRRGIGYHQQGVDPYRASGGEHWSGSYGKECPTARRVRQIPGIINQARSGTPAPPTPPSTGDGAMSWTDAQISQHLAQQKSLADSMSEVAQILRTEAVRSDNVTNKQLPDVRATLRAMLEQAGGDAGAIRAKLDEIAADTDRAADVTAGPDAT